MESPQIAIVSFGFNRTSARLEREKQNHKTSTAAGREEGFMEGTLGDFNSASRKEDTISKRDKKMCTPETSATVRNIDLRYAQAIIPR